MQVFATEERKWIHFSIFQEYAHTLLGAGFAFSFEVTNCDLKIALEASSFYYAIIPCVDN